MAGFSDQDDYLHQPEDHPDWRESWYFNWVDLESEISGFSTIGVLPHQPKREFVFALFVQGNPEFYFAEPKEPVPKEFSSVLDDGTLSYELVTPFDDWRIHYTSSRFQAELRWQQRFPACDFGTGSGTSWGQHLEQSGHVTGLITDPNGRVHYLEGYGQRDKSWTRFETGTIRKPIRAMTYLTDQTGRSFTLNSNLIHPLNFARYTRQFDGGETELFEEMVIHHCEELNQTGTGLAEWLFTH